MASQSSHLTTDGNEGKRPSLKARLAKIAPATLTLAALAFGLTAIRLAAEGRFDAAALAIAVAAVLDLADGAVARALSQSSAFGAELDSLADLVNFGVAPALLIYAEKLQGLHPWFWAAAVFYVCAASIRLARFNVDMAANTNIARTHFEGLPTTGAAMAVVMLRETMPATPGVLSGAILVAAGILMVSRWPVPKLATLFRSVFQRFRRS
jgi:CDP-diacylglycerol--serine O-phosphatidyltransferase